MQEWAAWRDASADDVLFLERGQQKASSLTEAARELGVSVSWVSERLTRIERRLGVHLIQRTTRRLALTTEGERYGSRGGRDRRREWRAWRSRFPSTASLSAEFGCTRRWGWAVRTSLGLAGASFCYPASACSG